MEEDILPALGLEWGDIGGQGPLPGSNRASSLLTSRSAKPQPTDQNPQRPKGIPVSPTFVNAPGAKRDWAYIAGQAIRRLTAANLTNLAKQIGIPDWALKQIQVGVTQTQEETVYTFPEFDGNGHITGMSVRFADGKTSCIRDSHRGLTLPKDWQNGDGPILIAEGASDTAALVAMGIAAVGRPNARGGIEPLLQLLQSVPIEREIIVLGEFNPKPDGSWPGRDGALHVAQTLADGLHRPITVSLPPSKIKDVRAWRADQCSKT